ncbi:hypothetical protein Clacol_002586 [Clathrus columnatus]|uniref:F-actin-capping protein subunit beta n=1 Tax=Clathrus columnatus TaxID=1419009 RepID=A0AAV5A167_9AGAM|nr:hypothetical protein Clacol_002586 [Clathrus columnatus]
MGDLLDSMLDLMRRLPPINVEDNVNSLISICPDYADDLLGSVDQPLKLKTDRATGKDYLACDYNRDGDSYRSPWSNEYDPPLEDGTVPSSKLRKLEIAANEAFDTYREMLSRFLSTIYVPLIISEAVLKPKEPSQPTGSWDSIHVFETSERGRQAHYKLTSTIMLNIIATKDAVGEVNLSGSMTRQHEQDGTLTDPTSHVSNIGRMIEDMEIKMRNLLQEVYFGKTRDVVHDLRSIESLERERKQREMQRELMGLMKR